MEQQEPRRDPRHFPRRRVGDAAIERPAAGRFCGECGQRLRPTDEVCPQCSTPRATFEQEPPAGPDAGSRSTLGRLLDPTRDAGAEPSGPFAGIGGLLSQRFGHRVESWPRFAEQPGGHYIDGGVLTSARVEIPFDQWLIVFDTFNPSKSTYTRVRAHLTMAEPFTFKIYRGTLFSEIGKLLGMQDIVTGIPAIDDRLIIQGHNREKITRMLSNEMIQTGLLDQPMLDIYTTSKDGRDLLEYQCLGVITELDRLMSLADLFVAMLTYLTDGDTLRLEQAAPDSLVAPGPDAPVAAQPSSSRLVDAQPPIGSPFAATAPPPVEPPATVAHDQPAAPPGHDSQPSPGPGGSGPERELAERRGGVTEIAPAGADPSRLLVGAAAAAAGGAGDRRPVENACEVQFEQTAAGVLDVTLRFIARTSDAGAPSVAASPPFKQYSYEREPNVYSREVTDALEALAVTLQAAGWRESPERGERWYSRRFTRR